MVMSIAAFAVPWPRVPARLCCEGIVVFDQIVEMIEAVTFPGQRQLNHRPNRARMKEERARQIDCKRAFASSSAV